MREGGSRERRETARDMCALDCSQCVSWLRRNWLHQAETPYCGHKLHEKQAKVPDSHFKDEFLFNEEMSIMVTNFQILFSNEGEDAVKTS